jgi:hypothetical protein
MVMKSINFWGVMVCGVVEFTELSANLLPPFLGSKDMLNKQRRSKLGLKTSLSLLNPEDGSSMFL